MPTYKSVHLTEYSHPVKSFTGDDKIYIVTYGINLYKDTAGDATKPKRNWHCSCPRWEHKCSKNGTYCKHIDYVLSLKPEQGGFCDWVGDENEVIIKYPYDVMQTLHKLLNIEESDWIDIDPDLIIDLMKSAWTTRKIYAPVLNSKSELIEAIEILDKSVITIDITGGQHMSINRKVTEVTKPQKSIPTSTQPKRRKQNMNLGARKIRS